VPFISAASFSRGSFRRADTTVFAPSSANRRAIAVPKFAVPEAPNMTAVFPASVDMVKITFYVHWN
jgi:hypothetical protein